MPVCTLVFPAIWFSSRSLYPSLDFASHTLSSYVSANLACEGTSLLCSQLLHLCISGSVASMLQHQTRQFRQMPPSNSAQNPCWLRSIQC